MMQTILFAVGAFHEAPEKAGARIDNPPATACQPPLHKGAFGGRFMNLPSTQTHTKRYYASTHIEQKRHASRSGGEKANTEHQIKVRQSLAYTQKPPSDKWHNERTVPNVRALSVSPARRALRRQTRGNT